MINRAILVGRLTRDPDLRYTASGAAVTTFTVAVNRQFTNQQGEREADFINCVMWRKPAEILGYNFCNIYSCPLLVFIRTSLNSSVNPNQ